MLANGTFFVVDLLTDRKKLNIGAAKEKICIMHLLANRMSYKTFFFLLAVLRFELKASQLLGHHLLVTVVGKLVRGHLDII